MYVLKVSCKACLLLFVIQNDVEVSFTTATEMLRQADIILMSLSVYCNSFLHWSDVGIL
jgi:hypothetical protein